MNVDQWNDSCGREVAAHAVQAWHPATLRLFVAGWNERPIRLYERLDFGEVGRETRHFELRGDHEVLPMEPAA